MAQIKAKKETAIVALLQSPTVREAAEKVQIAERTLWRWLEDESFRKQYTDARKAAFSRALALLQQGLGEAVIVLRDVMNCPDSNNTSRVSAAKAVIDTALRAMEMEDLENRISALERKADQLQRR